MQEGYSTVIKPHGNFSAYFASAEKMYKMLEHRWAKCIEIARDYVEK